MSRKFHRLPAGSVQLKGMAGKALDLTIANRLKKVDFTHLAEPFALRNEKDNMWRCEFWGKVMRSAIYAYCATKDPELEAKIHEGVKVLLSAQTPDGCISSYPAAKQLGGWDIWGRKYLLHALTRYVKVFGDEEVKKCCERLLSHLISQIHESGKSVLELGCHEGLAVCSILDTVVIMWELTGKEEFGAFAKEIVESGCSAKHNIFEMAIKKLPPAEIGNGKAYEMTSCFQGLAEYLQKVEEESYRESLLSYWDSLEEYELMVTGTGGHKDISGEFWNYGKWNQMKLCAGMSNAETCVTATLLRFADCLLRQEGDSRFADYIEKNLYNAAIGAMKIDGSTFCHANPTPLFRRAFKRPAPDQILGFGEDCCLAQGPEALAMAHLSAVMLSEKGELVLNAYEDLTAKFALPNGVKGTLTLTGGYPLQREVKGALSFEEGAGKKWTLLCRIPYFWNEKCSLSCKGKKITTLPGQYLAIEENWEEGDTITFTFDLTVRREDSPDYTRVALFSGPLLLAQDSRLTEEVDLPINTALPFTAKEGTGEIRKIWENAEGMRLAPYADAGNLFRLDNGLCVFLQEKK